MAQIIPLFPLRIVVFPGEKLNLHIFEERYKQLVNECLEQDLHFGIPAYIKDQVMKRATIVKMEEVSKKYANGELDIKTEGVQVARVMDFQKKLPGKLFPGGKVEPIQDDSSPDDLLHETLKEKMIELHQGLSLQQKKELFLNFRNTFEIAHHVGLSLQQEYRLLSLNSEQERQIFILQHLEKILPVISQMKLIREQVQMNGNFKHLIPPDLL